MRHPPLLVPPVATQVLRAWIDGTTTNPALRLRARIVVLSGAGLGPAAIARELGCSPRTVVGWRERFREAGVDGLSDAPRSGRPVTVDAGAVIRATVLAGSGGGPRWSTRLLARELGVSNVTVANVWRRWGVRPGPSGRVQLRVEPVLDRLPVEMLGLHVDRAVRLAAVRVHGQEAPRPPVTADWRTCVDSRLARVVGAAGDVGALTQRVDQRELTGFVRELGKIAARIGADGTLVPVRMIVEGIAEPIRRWARDQPAVVVHIVPPPLSWERVVQVMCLSAGTSEPGGRSSVDQLCAAVDRAAGRIPFSWTTSGSGQS